MDALIILKKVDNPTKFGVATLDKNSNIKKLVEKPKKPESNLAIIGTYIFSNKIFQAIKNIEPSWRGELEITDLNRLYLENNKLNVRIMGRGMAWLDTGTHDSLMQASNFIEAIEQRQGLKVACIEEIAYEMGYISKEKLVELAQPLKKNQYGQYLIRRADEDVLG